MSRYIHILAIALAVGLILGGVAIDYGPSLDSLPGISSLYGGKPSKAIVVRESGDAINLSQAQIAWIMSPALRADCRAAGIAFHVVDPQEADRDGNTPADLKAAIAKAESKGLPRLILVGTRGGLTDYVLPENEAAARKRLGIGG